MFFMKLHSSETPPHMTSPPEREREREGESGERGELCHTHATTRSQENQTEQIASPQNYMSIQRVLTN